MTQQLRKLLIILNKDRHFGLRNSVIIKNVFHSGSNSQSSFFILRKIVYLKFHFIYVLLAFILIFVSGICWSWKEKENARRESQWRKVIFLLFFYSFLVGKNRFLHILWILNFYLKMIRFIRRHIGCTRIQPSAWWFRSISKNLQLRLVLFIDFMYSISSCRRALTKWFMRLRRKSGSMKNKYFFSFNCLLLAELEWRLVQWLTQIVN